MHVSNLLTAVNFLNKFASGEGTISPFCTWIGDANLFLSHALQAAGITGTDSKVNPAINSDDVITAVLLLISLRSKLPLTPESKPVAYFTPPVSEPTVKK